MSTDDRDLRTLLTELHGRLHEAKAVDPDSRKLLATVAADIKGALERRDRPTTVPETRLRALAAKFEVEHPALAEAVRNVVDALGKAGI
jgi:FXSXX-COOH protein